MAGRPGDAVMMFLFSRRWGALAVATALVLALLAACSRTDPPGQGERTAGGTGDFLARHWKRPLAPQFTSGQAGAAQLASLDPARCGDCHAAQYADWRQSLHGKAMGPGITGQLAPFADPPAEEASQCTPCHAPLAEQSASLAASGPVPAAADSGLHAHGLACAGCHMREGRIFGPARRDGSTPAGDAAALPHGGWSAAPGFEDAKFCASCHQFDADGYALNGKLLENTYEEWRASPQAAAGQQCQSCHMPDRRHLWRGIHDPDMVRQALTIEASKPATRAGQLVAELKIGNTGAGHHFPTYVTPKVIVEGYQEDRGGRMLAQTLRSHEIARAVTPDLSREIADTRIPAGGQVVFNYSAPREPDAAVLVLRLRVDPDAFYRGVYQGLLARGATGEGAARLRQALKNAQESPFVAYATRIPLELH